MAINSRSNKQQQTFSTFSEKIRYLFYLLSQNNYLKFLIIAVVFLIVLNTIEKTLNYQPKNSERSSALENQQKTQTSEYEVKKLKESFNKIHDSSNLLLQKLNIIQEAKRLGYSFEEYSELYKVRKSKEVPIYPVAKNPSEIPYTWIAWFVSLTPEYKHYFFWHSLMSWSEKIFKGSLLIGVIKFLMETPLRKKQEHHLAWELINSAGEQRISGGRIEALQDLAKEGFSPKRSYVMFNYCCSFNQS